MEINWGAVAALSAVGVPAAIGLLWLVRAVASMQGRLDMFNMHLGDENGGIAKAVKTIAKNQRSHGKTLRVQGKQLEIQGRLISTMCKTCQGRQQQYEKVDSYLATRQDE